MDLFLHIRGGFALVCLGVLVLFGAALSLLRFANPSEEKARDGLVGPGPLWQA